MFQTPPAVVAPAPTPLRGVVVEGRTPSSVPPDSPAATYAAVTRLTGSALEGNADHWKTPICPKVSGLDPELSGFIEHRVREVARSAALQTYEGKCQPTLSIVVTLEPSRFVNAVWSRRPSLFGVTYYHTIMGFAESTNPVRWWRSHFDGGHSPRESSGNVRYALVVVDAQKAIGLRIGAIADYVAFVSLAPIKMNAQPIEGDHTILTLFSDREMGKTPPTGLTASDIALLKAANRLRDPSPPGYQREEMALEIRRVKPQDLNRSTETPADP